MKLNWTREYDDNDNAFYEAKASIGGEDENFYYRIKPVFREDRVFWEDDSSPDIVSCEMGPWVNPMDAALDFEEYDKDFLEALTGHET